MAIDPTMVIHRWFARIRPGRYKGSADPGLYFLPESRLTPIVQEECEACVVPRLAVAEVSIDKGDRLERPHRFLCGDKDIQGARNPITA